jgi:hypothetical protein
MRRNVAILASAVVLSSAAGAQAADRADPVFNIMGPSDCSRWPKRGSIDSAAKAVPLNWVLGFVSGEAERSDQRLFDLLQPEKVGAFLDAYCQEHPTDTLPAAGRALTAALEAELPPLPPPPPPMFIPPQATQAKPPAAEKPAAKRAAAKKPAARRPVARKPAQAAPKPAARPVAKPAAPAPARQPARS